MIPLANAEPFPSTYAPISSQATVISGATLLTGNGEKIEDGYLVMRDGRITEVGEGPAPSSDDLLQIDAKGKWLTPGIIDVHSHLGTSVSPAYGSDTNEATSPNTAKVWAEHSVWPQDPQFPLALAGGITALQILPGSANLFGGRGVTLKNINARSVQEMKFPGAPHGLKMACGENPKRVYGNKSKLPSTRMGNVAGFREAWIQAKEYQRSWQEYEKSLKEAESDDGADDKSKKPKSPPKRDLAMETLVGVLEGEILIHNHCYRADEMSVMIDIAKEFGYQITAFHHAVEAYKIADKLRENNICSAVWADWWRFKMESFDGIKENVALLEEAGACAVVHSDSAWGIQRLNQEAGKAMAAAKRMGMEVDEALAITWLTRNAARALGVLDQTGTLEKGKMADVVLWDGNPFSIYTKTDKVYVDGFLAFDRATGRRPVTDFELGHRRAER